MNASDIHLVPVDRFDPAMLRRYRLRPMACVPEGWIIWARGIRTLALSAPRRHSDPPDETDTAILSINQYRRVTRAIADAEAS